MSAFDHVRYTAKTFKEYVKLVPWTHYTGACGHGHVRTLDTDNIPRCLMEAWGWPVFDEEDPDVTVEEVLNRHGKV